MKKYLLALLATPAMAIFYMNGYELVSTTTMNPGFSNIIWGAGITGSFNSTTIWITNQVQDLGVSNVVFAGSITGSVDNVSRTLWLTSVVASGVAQSPVTGTIDYVGNVMTGATIVALSLVAGSGNSFGAGASNNFTTLGGGIFGASARHNFNAGYGNTFGNSVERNFVWGTNNTTSSSIVFLGGRECTAAGLYSVLVGGYRNYVGGQAAFLGGGWYNTNAVGADYSVIGGGVHNRVAANYAAVGGGVTNRALAIGSTIPGGGFATVASTGDYSLAYNAAPTNSFTFGTKQAWGLNLPGGFYITSGTGSLSFTESGLTVNGVLK